MITIMIGSNDFCSNVCYVPSPWSIIDDHRKDLIKTLRVLRDNLPRTYVSLILPPHLKVLAEALQGRNILRCYLATMVECPCLTGQQHLNSRPLYYEVIKRFVRFDEYTIIIRNITFLVA